jgi:ABC-type uncharacterized transport system involved in gliding motility auxiliary subunit/ABC-type transport system involved in multi-copper enzyme maturation permease subunit
MQSLGTVFKREVQAYFTQPIMYVVIGGVLLIVGFLYYLSWRWFLGVSFEAMRNPMLARELDLSTMVVGSTIGTIGVVSVFALPLLPMRLWAAEKRSGTVELLLTFPPRDPDIVLGKFLAAFAVYGVLLALTLLYPLLAASFGRLDAGPILSGYFGTLLLGAALLALGLLCSTWTENQIVACAWSWTGFLFFWLIGHAADSVGGQLGTVLTHVSFANHHSNFVKGIIETQSVAYFVLFCLFCLFLTLRSMFTPIVLAVLVILYAVAGQHKHRFDVTSTKRFTLATQSVKLVQGLQQSLKVIGFYSLAEREREAFTNLLDQYTQHTDKISYELVDPDRQPALAKQYDITAYNTVVVEGNDKKEKVLRLDEAALTNAILKVTHSTKKVVYFLTGHGEPALTDSDRNGYSVTKQTLEEQSYTVKELVLTNQAQVPDDAAVVVVAGPQRDLLGAELEALSAYLGRGGHLYLMIEPYTAPDLVTFVKRYGLEVGNDVVIETNPLGRLIGGDYLMPVVMAYERHAITKELGNVMTIFPVVRSVQVARDLPSGITAQGLAMTSAESWAETDLKALQDGHTAFDPESDQRGPITIAAVATMQASDTGTSASPLGTSPSSGAEPPGQSDSTKNARAARLVVFGDAEFANNNFITLQGNAELFLNTVSWLAEQEEPLAIRPREGGGNGPVTLTAAQQPFIFWLPVVVLPLTVFGTGAMVFMRRWHTGGADPAAPGN